MPTFREISDKIDSYCRDNQIDIAAHPLLQQAKKLLIGEPIDIDGEDFLWQENFTPNEDTLSALVELFKPNLQKWKQKELSVELSLLPILVNATLPTCDRLPSFKNMELDLEDIHFLEVQNSFSEAWRIPVGEQDTTDNANIEKMTKHFLSKYASKHFSVCHELATDYLKENHADPFQMTASLVILAKNNLIYDEIISLISFMAEIFEFSYQKNYFCNLSNIATSLVTLRDCNILSGYTLSMIYEYMLFGITNEDWRVLSLHDADPNGLTFFCKLLVDLDMWSEENANLIFSNKKTVMEIIGNESLHEPFANLLRLLKERELLTTERLQMIIGNNWILQNLAHCAEECLSIIPGYFWNNDILEKIITACTVNEYAAVSSAHLQQIIQQPQEAPYIQEEPAAPARAEGNSQSTHSMSVHTTVAFSLHRLDKRYQLNESQINAKLRELEDFAHDITTLDTYAHLNDTNLGEIKTELAAQSIRRLVELARQNTVQEGQTRFGLRKILALVWSGVQDENSHDKPSEIVVKDKFINELYNIETTYGFQEDGDGAHSCDAGSINGLLLALDRLHADVNIDLIDKTAITEKTLLEAKEMFIEQLKLAISNGKNKNFIQEYDAEIENTDWQHDAIQTWYTNCLIEIHEQSIQNTFARIDAARIDDEIKVAELKEQAKKWVDDAIKALENKYLIDSTIDDYNKIKSSQSSKNEQAKRNQETREARLEYFCNQNNQKTPFDLPLAADTNETVPSSSSSNSPENNKLQQEIRDNRNAFLGNLENKKLQEIDIYTETSPTKFFMIAEYVLKFLANLLLTIFCFILLPLILFFHGNIFAENKRNSGSYFDFFSKDKSRHLNEEVRTARLKHFSNSTVNDETTATNSSSSQRDTTQSGSSNNASTTNP